MITYSQLLRDTETQLKKNNPDTANQEAYFLIKELCQLTSSELILRAQDPVPETTVNHIQNALKRRLNNTPLDLIIGQSNFFGSNYHVEKGVLIPRAETELLVETAIQLLSETKTPPLPVIECGSGSGIISIECAKKFPDRHFMAWDISEQAITLSQKNAKKFNVRNVQWIHGNFFSTTAPWKKLNSPFICLSNPPYIPSKDLQTLDPSVKNYDPMTALDGGTDGLDIYKQLFQTLAPHCKYLILECGIHQSPLIQTIAKQHHYTLTQQIPDLNRIPRILVFHYHPKNSPLQA